MRQYDAIFIFKTEEENFSKGKSDVQEEIKKLGIKVIQEVDMGLKDLAYEIKKHKQGHYINFEVESDNPSVLKELETICNLKTEILKFVFFRKEL